ncbi:hypothetical protein BHE74_00020051 [Ensete ventricosum]|nr:hypothetical protein BHE74_00020051 [Ensete ventricosum]
MSSLSKVMVLPRGCEPRLRICIIPLSGWDKSHFYCSRFPTLFFDLLGSPFLRSSGSFGRFLVDKVEMSSSLDSSNVRSIPSVRSRGTSLGSAMDQSALRGMPKVSTGKSTPAAWVTPSSLEVCVEAAPRIATAPTPKMLVEKLV